MIPLVHRIIRLRYRQLGFRSSSVSLDRFTIHSVQSACDSSHPPILFLHGLGTSSSTWVRIMPELARDRNVLAIDLPGFGLSTIDRGMPVASFDELVELTSSYLQNRSAAPVTLIGHSLGGWIAGKIATRHASVVGRLILMNPAGVYTPDVDRLAALFDARKTSDVAALLDMMWYHFPWYYSLFLRSIRKDLTRRRIGEFVRSIVRTNFLSEELGALPIRTSLIWGENDRLLPRETVSTLARWIPGLQISFIPKCGHIPQLEAPHRCARVVLNHLDGRFDAVV